MDSGVVFFAILLGLCLFWNLSPHYQHWYMLPVCFAASFGLLYLSAWLIAAFSQTHKECEERERQLREKLTQTEEELSRKRDSSS